MIIRRHLCSDTLLHTRIPENRLQKSKINIEKSKICGLWQFPFWLTELKDRPQGGVMTIAFGGRCVRRRDTDVGAGSSVSWRNWLRRYKAGPLSTGRLSAMNGLIEINQS